MYFKIKSTVLFRNYETFGYLTDNRNFGYKQINEKPIGDKILSESGAAFLSALDREPQTLDNIIENIQKQFIDADYRAIKEDAKDFYCILEQDGFIVSGKTFKECNEKDIRFSYRRSESQITQNSLDIIPSKKTTQDFLEEYFSGKPQLTSLHIEITSKCNERCIHCYIPHSNKLSHIQPELFYDVLAQCKSLRLLHITISGGEPMLHNHFCDFLKKCREYDLSVNVLSNLTLLDDNIIDEMKANPLLGVQVSLYSMNADIHDEITQMKGSFKKTKNAILKLVKNDIPLQISCPILKQNKNCYKEVVEWGEKYGIEVGDDYVIIGRYNHTTQNLSCRLSINEINEVLSDKFTSDAKFLNQLEEKARKKKNILPNDYVCSVCHSSICISENGNVYPCAGWQDYIVGSVKEKSLSEIWYDSEKVQYLRNLRNNDFPECISCSDKNYCTMCMVRNANENPAGDPLVVNEFFCSISKLYRNISLEYKF